jgi:hypothetical protein
VSVKMAIAKGALGSLFTMLKRIKTKTWIMLGVVFMLFLALLVWAALSLVGWIWGGTQSVLQHAGIDGQSLEQASAKVSGKAQDYLEQARDKLASTPTLQDLSAQAQQQAATAMAKAVPAEAELALAAGAAVLAGSSVAATAALGELREVSGADIGPARFPGLVRTQFSRTADLTSVQYQGSADFNRVIAHYVDGFASLGFNNEVMSADTMHETHRFQKAGERIELSVKRRQAGLLSVRLQRSKGS